MNASNVAHAGIQRLARERRYRPCRVRICRVEPADAFGR